MKNLRNIILIFTASLFINSCVEEKPFNNNIIEGLPAEMGLTVKTTDRDIQTRAGRVAEYEESKIKNLYVMVFNHDGNIDDSYWSGEIQETYNTKTLDINNIHSGNNKEIYVIANIENPVVGNGFKDKLDQVRTKDDLQDLNFKLFYESSQRGSNFTMVGKVSGVNIYSDKSKNNFSVELERIDVKIRFNISFDTTNIKEFVPNKWRVINLPKEMSLTKIADGEFNNLSSDQYFNTQWQYLNQTTNKDEAYFDFFMFESKVAPKKNIPEKAEDGTNYTAAQRYALRAKQEKNPIEGTNYVENGDFIYASQHATYVEITGDVLETDESGKSQTTHARYLIHLGYNKANPNDYCVERNTFYKYSVQIKSTENILLEVTTGVENQPGAEGDIDISDIEYIIDSHYSVLNANFAFNNLSEHITWIVSTPFSKGISDDFKGKIVDNDWIRFKINAKSGNSYNENFKVFKGDQDIYNTANPFSFTQYIADVRAGKDKMLNVDQLVEVLSTCVKNKNRGSDHLFDANGDIKFTTFVNENYYDADPLTGDKSRVLWKKFCNLEDRKISIASDYKASADQESSRSTTLYSFKQASIQTMYRMDTNDEFTAWGTDMYNQYEHSITFDGGKEHKQTDANAIVNKCSDKANGRKNTINLMGVDSRSLKWDTYIDMNTWTLKSDYKTARYGSLLLNRDSDGDGTIDPEEIRWYLPSINQLTDYWIGERSFDQRARLFKGTTWSDSDYSERNNEWYVSSTVSGTIKGSYQWIPASHYYRYLSPMLLWASEGTSVGNLSGITNNQNGPVFYRCVRNLGIEANQAELDIVPDDFARYDKSSQIMYLDRLDANSIRDYMQEEELPEHHERERTNLPARSFVVSTSCYGGGYTWKEFHEKVSSGNSPIPEGWRTPNQRELALMYSRIGNDGYWTKDHHYTSTRFQFGTDANERLGFSLYEQAWNIKLTHRSDKKGGVRPVRDNY